MTLTDIISFLRQSVIVQDTTVTPNNPEYLTMTDGDMQLLLTVALSRVEPEADLDTLDNEYLYPLILQAKKELFFRLALPKAQKSSISAGKGVMLNKQQVFDHYMTLISDVEKEFSEYESTGKPVKSGDVYLDSRYFSFRNYNHASEPVVKLTSDNIYQTSIELSWVLSKVSKFSKFELYKGTSTNIDAYYKKEFSYDKLVKDTAIKVDTFYDVHQNKFRVSDLTPDTLYFLTIVVQERNGMKGYSEIQVTTLP